MNDKDNNNVRKQRRNTGFLINSNSLLVELLKERKKEGNVTSIELYS